MQTTTKELIKTYNHNLSVKLVEKANYENELEDENENFDWTEFLFGKEKK